ncbi:unnamed protein product [Rotaria sp. Silwood2]|nr:unnamed protein product [Rotaria sp. Silwood2]CAF2566482.1 unnamed protein product [Rotaria sp. Silwood2]CAF2811092.1 unnamed protein product [Rotaria sp. Silwood2]CAF2916149.1 unnamed protein product [Rotaria sp. Silwood2]CAF3855859.1 unnamed protein product [Rotaria sp. Silwood2]
MQSTPFSTSTSSSWVTSNNSNLNTNNSNFWSNGGFRKRKAAASELEEKTNQKMFVTEEKMLKEMQTLSLDLVPPDNNTIPIPASSINDELIIDEIPTNKINEDDHNDEDDDDDDEKEKCSEETRFELHKLLKDSLKNDDLQDSLLNKLCEIER